MTHKRYLIIPIDIDFAGWTEVEAGEHNAWGVVDTQNNSLEYYSSMKLLADNKAKELNGA